MVQEMTISAVIEIRHIDKMRSDIDHEAKRHVLSSSRIFYNRRINIVKINLNWY